MTAPNKKRTFRNFEASPSIASRVMWAATHAGDYIVSRFEAVKKDGTEYAKYLDLVHHPSISEVGDDIVLYFPHGKRFWNIRLTAYTEKELNLIKQVFDKAFELALPVVKERDKNAQEAYEAGEDFYTRVYRSVPRLFVR